MKGEIRGVMLKNNNFLLKDGVGRRHEYSKDIIFNTAERRSAISTSELGLYSDHSDYYNTVNQGATVRKFAIGIMVVVSVLLVSLSLNFHLLPAQFFKAYPQQSSLNYLISQIFKQSRCVIIGEIFSNPTKKKKKRGKF